jgi:hypothetical protein
MNRWIWPGAVVATVAAAIVVAGLVGAQAVPQVPFSASETRVSVVCPGFESATATVRVAAVATGRGLRTAKVDDPAGGSDASGLKVVNAPGAFLRVSALLPDPFGAVSVVSASAGADRGLSASACATPSTDHWFTGVDIREVAQSEVVVANLDGTPASVDLTVWGSKGRIAAPRGIEVNGNSVQTISLGTLERNAAPVSVEVSSGDGRIAAFVRQRTWQGSEPLGADWLPETVAPATDIVVPGLPSGAGQRTVVVANPGDRTATVTIGTLTASGPGGITGIGQLEVPAESVRSVDLAAGLDGQAFSLALSSTQPVTAGVWLDAGGGTANHDPAFTAGTRALPQDSVWPLALGAAAKTVLQLANPSDTEVTATVTMGTSAPDGQPQQVAVPAGSTVEVPVASSATTVIRLQTAAAGLRGALVSRASLGKVRGLTVVDLSADDSRSGLAPVVFDPQAGS